MGAVFGPRVRSPQQLRCSARGFIHSTMAGELLIDGSVLEGGGQIIRTTLSLAWLVCGRPLTPPIACHPPPPLNAPLPGVNPCPAGRSLRLVRIRDGRSTPGLASQHLASVRLAAELGGLCVHGAELRSTELCVTSDGSTLRSQEDLRSEPAPGSEQTLRRGDALSCSEQTACNPHAARFPGQDPVMFVADAHGAGSTMLMLQAALPPLLFCAPAGALLVLRGGTDAAFAPPCDYARLVLAPLLRRFGIHLAFEAVRRGFYPRGGGEVRVRALRPETGPCADSAGVGAGAPCYSAGEWLAADGPGRPVSQRQAHADAAAGIANPPATLRAVDMMDRGAPTLVLVSLTCEDVGTAGAAALAEALRLRLPSVVGVPLSAVRVGVNGATEPCGANGEGSKGSGHSERGRSRGGRQGRCRRRCEISTQIAIYTSSGCVLSVNHLGCLSPAASSGRDDACTAPAATGEWLPAGAGGKMAAGGDGECSEAAAARAATLCAQVSALLASGACVDEHTADQLIVFMALAKGTSRLLAPPRGMLTSLHLETVATFAAQLTGAKITVRAVPRTQTVSVSAGTGGGAHPDVGAAQAEACLIVECEGVGVTLPPRLS